MDWMYADENSRWGGTIWDFGLHRESKNNSQPPFI